MSKLSERRVHDEVSSLKTRNLLVRTASRVLPGDDSEDAAHDAVVQALVHAGKFREDAQVATWLYRIAFNAALVRRRCAQRTSQRLQRVQREQGVTLGTAHAPISTRLDSARALEEQELRSRLRAAVNALPPDYRTVVERCVYQEQDADQVAAELGISASALRTRITRARDRLRDLLQVEPMARAA